MKRRMAGTGWIWGGVSVVVAAQACAGKSIHDVGDVNTSRSGSAGTTLTADAGAGGASDPSPEQGGPMGGSGKEPNIGSGGTGPYVIEAGGEGGVGATHAPICDGCLLVAEEQGDISDIEVDASRAYWIDHGTYDEFHNHRDDGRLVARGLNGGELEVLSEGLPGPLDLELTSSYAYLLVNALSGARSWGIMRVPLAGGAPQTIATWSPNEVGNGALTTNADHAFFAQPTSTDGVAGLDIYGLDDAVDADPQLIWAGSVGQGMLADASRLYVFSREEAYAVPLSGGEPTLFASLWGEPAPIKVEGGYVYTIEIDRASSYLVRTATADGGRKRLAEARGYADQYDILGGAFFESAPVQGGPQGYPIRDRVYQGELATGDRTTLILGELGMVEHLAASSVGLFYAGDGAVSMAPYRP